MKQQTIPLGLDDFREIREQNHYYIDKTLFIKDFTFNGAKVSLITRPRRFGKTLNLSMMYHFFDINSDSKAIFSGLAICETELYTQINSVPVIFLTFKDCTAKSLDSMLKMMAKNMMWMYDNYYEIFKNSYDKNSLVYQKFLERYNDLKEKSNAAEVLKTYLIDSIELLTKVLRHYYGVRPLVLIDEYDQPIITAHQYGFREEMTDLIGSMFGCAFKTNPHVGLVLLTGIQRVAKESIFSRLNNVAIYTTMDEDYACYFGLTEAEVQQMLVDFQMSEPLTDVKKFYDGYAFGKTYHMYNPWSVLSFIKYKRLESYWVNTSTNLLIRQLILNASTTFVQHFDELISKGQAEVFVNLTASFIELQEDATLWGLLINAGYLTITGHVDGYVKIITIPNHEVRTEFVSLISKRTGLDNTYLMSMINGLLAADMDRFLINYQRLVDHYMSFRHQKEANFQSFLLGLLVTTTGMYEVSSECEAGDGLPDIMMKSKFPHIRPHVIIELKVVKNEIVLSNLQQALEQIDKKRYDALLEGEIVHVGLVHHSKKCEMIYKKVYRKKVG